MRTGEPGRGLEHRHAREHAVRHLRRLALVPSRKEDGELVASDPEGLSVLTQPRGDLREDLVAPRVPEPVVELFEVVDVEDADAQRHPLVLRLRQVAIEPLVEMAVVAQAGERVGEGEAHRRELPEDRALVEGDRGERPDERSGEEGRALPEDREHERERGHDREGDERRGDGPPEQGEKAVAGPPADDRCDEGGG